MADFPDASAKLTKAEKRKLEGQARRRERFEAVKELHGQGLYIAEIVRPLKMDFGTINRYVQADECPMYPGRVRASKLDPYKEHITQRWQSGCHNSTEILNEIRQLGYNGSRSIMMDWVAIDFSQKNSDFEWDILGWYNNMNITSHKYNIIRGDTHEPAYARFPSN